MSPSDPDLDLHVLSLEGYSKLSDENLNTILRSFTEALQQKKLHLNLLDKITCEDKDELINQTRENMDTLNHDIRCISAEISSRKTSKNSDDWLFPVVHDQDDEDQPLDLKIITELVGPSFDELDKLKFLEQYLSIVHYSRTHPISGRQLQQIFHLKLKGKALLFFSSLPASLPLKDRIRKLLTVFAYRHHGSDRLIELEEFSRQRNERLDSVYLRLTSILDASASLVRPSLRQARNEFFLCQAMFSLSLPGVRARLAKYQAERTGEGLYVTSTDLLKKATKFEETVISGRSEEVRLGLKDPFVSVGEIPNAFKRNKQPKTDREDRHTPNNQDLIAPEPEPLPNPWVDDFQPRERQNRSDVRKDIQALNKKIDELSQVYEQKLHLAQKPKEEVEVHNVTQESAGSAGSPNPAMTEVWEKMVQPFLEAQWRFYSSYNYGKTPELASAAPNVQYERWGSRYRRDEGPRPSNWNPASSIRQSPQSRPWYGRNGSSEGYQERYTRMRPGSFPINQPRKRVRFSEWIQAENARQPVEDGSVVRQQPGQNNGNQNRNNSNENQPINHGRSNRASNMAENGTRNGGMKRAPEDTPKGEPNKPQIASARLHPAAGADLDKNMFQDMPGPN